MNSRELTLTLSALLVLASGTARLLLGPAGGTTEDSLAVGEDPLPDDQGDPLLASTDPEDSTAGQIAPGENEDSDSPAAAAPARRGWVLRGRILGSVGQVVPHAQISCEAIRSKVDGSRLMADEPAPHTRTGDDGRFELALPIKKSVSITLCVQASGHASLLSEHVLETGGNEGDLGDLPLGVGGVLRGRILGPTSRGISGAELTLEPAISRRRARLIERLGILPPFRSADDGTYRIQHLIPGSYRLTATARGMQQTRVPGFLQIEHGKEVRVPDLELQPGHELSGIVYDPAGKTVAGASLHIGVSAGKGRLDQNHLTDEEGRFHADHLPPDLLRLEVRAEGFLTWKRVDVDARQARDLIVRLEPGLRIQGRVLDARTGQAILQYASAIRLRHSLDLARRGEPHLQLARQIRELHLDARTATEVDRRSADSRLERALRSRLTMTERGDSGIRVLAPEAVGPIETHSDGRFSFAGLDEGVYVVDIAPPHHESRRLGPFELRRGKAQPMQVVKLSPGLAIHGRVLLAGDGKPLPAATVTLSLVDRTYANESPTKTGRIPWLFEAAGPMGRALAHQQTDESGSFRFDRLTRGRYNLTIRAPGIVTLTSQTLDLASTQDDLTLRVGDAPSLKGRVIGIPPTLATPVQVLAIGGYGTVSLATVARDGSYGFDALQPGGYRVLAFAGDAAKALDQQIRSLRARARRQDPTKGPLRPDLVLTRGERRRLDLRFEIGPIGRVTGHIAVRHGPARGFWVVLRPLPGPAPGPAARSVSKRVDLRGAFVFPDTMAGKYRFQVYSPTSQRLHEQEVSVHANQTTRLQIDLITGGLSGSILPSAGIDAESLRGTVYVLPDATEVPKDLREYRRTHPVQYIRIRQGQFRAEHLRPGAALLLVRIRGHESTSRQVHIPTASVRKIQLRAGQKL